MKRNPSCRVCGLAGGCHTPCLWGGGSKNSVMLVGEAPGMNEDLQGSPFVGQAGKLLDFVLTKLGMKREMFYVTNALKCRPRDNKLPGIRLVKEYFKTCALYLDEEVAEARPRAMLLMGSTPLQLLTDHRMISRCEGMKVLNLRYPKIKTFASFHPAYVLRSPSKEVRLAQALWGAMLAAGMKPRTLGWGGVYDYKVQL